MSLLRLAWPPVALFLSASALSLAAVTPLPQVLLLCHTLETKNRGLRSFSPFRSTLAAATQQGSKPAHMKSTPAGGTTPSSPAPGRCLSPQAPPPQAGSSPPLAVFSLVFFLSWASCEIHPYQTFLTTADKNSNFPSYLFTSYNLLLGSSLPDTDSGSIS